jgi:hypothetical protein
MLACVHAAALTQLYVSPILIYVPAVMVRASCRADECLMILTD